MHLRVGLGTAEVKRTELTRTTGLAQGKPLAAGKGLTRGAGLTRSTPIAASAAAGTRPPAKPRAPRVASAVRDVVLARSGGRCELGATDACRALRRRLDSAEGGSQHHRLPARMGGSKRTVVHGPANLIQVCGHGTAGCHGWLESHRTAALANGWLLHAGEDPAARPVLLHDGRRVLLGPSYVTPP